MIIKKAEKLPFSRIKPIFDRFKRGAEDIRAFEMREPNYKDMGFLYYQIFHESKNLSFDERKIILENIFCCIVNMEPLLGWKDSSNNKNLIPTLHNMLLKDINSFISSEIKPMLDEHLQARDEGIVDKIIGYILYDLYDYE